MSIIKFVRDHDHHPAPGQIVAYRNGATLSVDDELAEHFKSVGAAVDAEIAAEGEGDDPAPAPKAAKGAAKTRVDELKEAAGDA